MAGYDFQTQGPRDCLLVLSGGMDSVTMLHHYRERIALAVTFNYGSNHNERETECARACCQALGIEHIVIPLAFIGQNFRSALLSGAGAIPDGDYAPENLSQTIVPFRNGIMLSAAAGLAESRGLKHVMLANHAGDHVIYPDCRPEFVKAMNAAIQAGTAPGVTLVAPYTMLTKAKIARIGYDCGVDYSHTYSCYRGGLTHCGTCATCLERKEALTSLPGGDPTIYQNP